MIRYGIFCLGLCALCLLVVAEDWPQWRGPRRDGTWTEEGIVAQFDTPVLEPVWRTGISSGYSGPTVAAGMVYVMDRVTGELERERILCFDARTGAPLWNHAYECAYENISSRAGPRAAVTIHAGRAYALGSMGHLHCLDARSGALLWAKDLRTAYDARIPVWGICSAPLIEGGLVIVQAGGRNAACVVALDAVTGQERWTALDDPASYSSPIAIDQAGVRVVVCWTAARIVGLAAASGALLWEAAFPEPRRIIAVADPVVEQDRLFVSDYWEGSLMLRLSGAEPAVSRLWYRKGSSERQTEALHALTSTPVLEDGLIYGVDSFGEFRCLLQRNGDRVWENLDLLPRQRWGTMHIVRQADRAWVFTELGELAIVRLVPFGLDIISRAQLIEPTKAQHARGVCWSHPAFANRHVYIRNDRELLAVNLAAGAEPPVHEDGPGK